MRNRLELLALSAISAFPLQYALAQTQENRPNVIYIMADDLGIGDLGCYGQTKIKTPAIDRLAENGIRFTQHYTGAPVSAPSRCSLLTGKHIGHACIRGNKATVSKEDGKSYDYPLADNEVTAGEVFKQKNYITACIGKWGLGGPGSEGEPGKQGFDYFYGYLGQGHAHSYYPEFLHENSTKIMLNGEKYTHDLIAGKALEFIDKNADKPFFLYFTPTIPHADLQVPEGELYDYEFPEVPYDGNGGYRPQDKPRATYAAMVTRLDKDVQRIMDLLEAKGIADNTIVIFTSDNGVHQEGGNTPDFFNSNGIYRGYKRDLYEGGVRTPFIVHWPAKIKQASVTGHPSAFWDFLPTMCDVIGVEKPENVDGISYLPTLTGEAQQQDHNYFYWEFHEQGGKRSILKGDFKLIELFVNNLKKNTYELYNITNDPGETTDLAAQNPDKVNDLKVLLHKERTKNAVWNFAEIIVVENAEIITVKSAKASIFQTNQNIDKSYDKNYTTLYHSKYDEKGVTVNLQYNFDPTTVSTIVYSTRMDGEENGNFKKFELWALPSENADTDYVKVGDYDFDGVMGSHRIDFTGEAALVMKSVKSVRFVVEPGVSNLVSCSEMTFYRKNPVIEEIEGLEIVNIRSADSSSEEDDSRGIAKSFDRDFKTNYHSKFKGLTVFPVQLNYYFDPINVKKIIYFTRVSDGGNGNFKEFDLYTLPDESTEYVKLGSYDFKGELGEHCIDLTEEQQKLAADSKGLRFVVRSGQNNFASCSEIVFYGDRILTSVRDMRGRENSSYVVQDRRIVQVGEDNSEPFNIYSTIGTAIDSDATLDPGVYIVRSGNIVTKVWVK